MKKQASFLKFMVDANKKQTKLIVKTLTTDQLDVIGDVALNIYTAAFPVKPSYLKRLKPYKAAIRLLGSREISGKKKRNILSKRLKLLSILFKPVVDELRKDE